MRITPLSLACLAVLPFIPQTGFSQTDWQVIAGVNPAVVMPGLSVGNRIYSDVLLGDVGNRHIGIRMASPSATAGYWALKQGTWARYTEIGVGGDLVGPGRTGIESNHVFSDIVSGGSNAGADGQRVFFARANAPGNSAGATWGLWRWDLTRNVEVARVLTDGVLGPNLGAGWVFPNVSDFSSARAMNGGSVLINADVTTPTGLTRRYLVKHVPGQGNVPCMLRDSVDPALSPGLTAGDSFNSQWTLANIALTVEGRVYGSFYASGARDGIWEVCSGPPRALAVNAETGARGPSVGIATATFASNSSFGTPRPGIANSFYFASRFRTVANESPRPGLFWNDGSSNRPLAINDSAGIYGPGWQQSTWISFDEDQLMAGGRYAAFTAIVGTPDGGTPAGMWRVRAGGSPELVALIGLVGAYGPEANRTWASFGERTILANGDILMLARTNPGNEDALWLLKPGSSPARVLGVGQNVTVPTASGNVQASVGDFAFSSGVANYSSGEDSWVGADGSALISASVTGYGSVRLLGVPGNMTDRIFVSGFDR